MWWHYLHVILPDVASVYPETHLTQVFAIKCIVEPLALFWEFYYDIVGNFGEHWIWWNGSHWYLNLAIWMLVMRALSSIGEVLIWWSIPNIAKFKTCHRRFSLIINLCPYCCFKFSIGTSVLHKNVSSIKNLVLRVVSFWALLLGSKHCHLGFYEIYKSSG